MGISGSQKAPLYALAGVARAGATRSGYTSPKVFVSVNGVQYATARPIDANKVLYETGLAVTEVLNETPNTCAFTMQGAEPTEGQDVVITLGSINNLDRTFAGTILNRSHGYVGTPSNWNAPINVIDYTWHLTRRRFTGSFTNAAPADILAAIVAVVPGFTASAQSGLAPLDAFSQTDVTAMQALVALAKRVGGYCDVDYHKVVKLFIADTSVTNPVSLTSAHVSLSEFSYTKDLSQTRTRIYSEGGGVTALTQVNPGETILPLSTVAWYNASGGQVKSRTQHITYTAARDSGGGSLIGPGVAPSVAPVLWWAGGAGLSDGTYLYEYTDVTAAGESLPGPQASIALGTVPPPPAFTLTNLGFDASSGLAAGTYIYALTYVPLDVNGAALPFETTQSATASITVAAGDRVLLNLGGTILARTARQAYRTVVGGTQLKKLFLIGNTAGNIIDPRADASLGANVPTVNTAIMNQVDVSGIALGASPTTQRKVYRSVANGTQPKLQQTIANNTVTIGVRDATADGSLGANAPTGDTSGLTLVTGQVLAGATSLLTAGAGAFASGGGWALIQGDQFIRYGGVTGNTLTGIPASGIGAITVTIAYNSTIVDSPVLIGIPASGPGSIQYQIQKGDPVNLLVQVDDLAAQAALAALIGGGDDGVIEEYIQDGAIGETEARARATAQLALLSTAQVSIAYKCRDKNTHAGRTVTVSLGAPTSLSAMFQIQHVTVDTFQPALMPTYTVQASNNRFSLEDLLRMVRQQAT